MLVPGCCCGLPCNPTEQQLLSEALPGMQHCLYTPDQQPIPGEGPCTAQAAKQVTAGAASEAWSWTSVLAHMQSVGLAQCEHGPQS